MNLSDSEVFKYQNKETLFFSASAWHITSHKKVYDILTEQK